VPHPFRFFLRKGWDTNEFWVYTISENALQFLLFVQKIAVESWSNRNLKLNEKEPPGQAALFRLKLRNSETYPRVIVPSHVLALAGIAFPVNHVDVTFLVSV